MSTGYSVGGGQFEFEFEFGHWIAWGKGTSSSSSLCVGLMVVV